MDEVYIYISMYENLWSFSHYFYFQEDDLKSAVEESARIREDYQKYFDLEIPVEDTEEAFRTIMDTLVKLTNESQWVPLNWVYSWSQHSFIHHSAKLSIPWVFFYNFYFVNIDLDCRSLENLGINLTNLFIFLSKLQIRWEIK